MALVVAEGSALPIPSTSGGPIVSTTSPSSVHIASLHVSWGGGVVASAQTASGPTGSVTLETTVKDAAPGQYVVAVTRTSKDGTESRIGTDVVVTVP